MKKEQKNNTKTITSKNIPVSFLCSEDVANKLSNHCKEKGLVKGRILENLILEYLEKGGVK